MKHRGRLFDGDSEALARRMNDADVGLVRNDQRDVVGVHARGSQRLLSRVDHDPDGATKDFLALHLDVSTDVGIEKVLRGSIGVQIPGEQLSGTVDRFEHHGAGTVGEQHRGVAIGPIGDARQGVGADHQHLAGSDGDESVSDREGVHETAAGGIHVEGPARQSERVLHVGRRGRHGAVRRGGGENQCVDLARIHPRHGECSSSALDAELGRGSSDMAFGDSAAFLDPLVRRVECFGQIGVRDHLFRQCAAPSGDDGSPSTGHGGRHLRPSSARRSVAAE